MGIQDKEMGVLKQKMIAFISGYKQYVGSLENRIRVLEEEKK